MNKKVLICFAIITSYGNTYCFDYKKEHRKGIFTSMKWGVGVTASCAILGVLADTESSLQEKLSIVTLSVLFSGITSGIVGMLSGESLAINLDLKTKLTDQEKVFLHTQHAKKTGILCGLAVPITACITYCRGGNPKSLYNILHTFTQLEDTFKRTLFIG
jgi:hypothetical protein